MNNPITQAIEALALILPMAKGYAHQHPVGNNSAFCDQAEAALASLRAAQEGDLPPLLTEERIAACIDEANRNFNGRKQGPSGQQMTTYDDWKYWLARAIESEVRTAIAAAGGGVPYSVQRYLQDTLESGTVTEQIVARTALSLLASSPQPEAAQTWHDTAAGAHFKQAHGYGVQPEAAPAVAQVPMQWEYGPNEWKDWCAQWFGPDSDDDYLAKAVFDLPVMAQKFRISAAPEAPAQAPQADPLEALTREQERLGLYDDMAPQAEQPVAQASEERAEPEFPLSAWQTLEYAKRALSAMLTHMGMDEDEFNKPTFDQARSAVRALEYQLATPDQVALWKKRYQQIKEPFSRFHEQAVAAGFDGISDALAALRAHPEPVAQPVAGEVVGFLATDSKGRQYLCFAPKDDEQAHPLYLYPPTTEQDRKEQP